MASKNVRLRKKIERARLSKSYPRKASELTLIYEIKMNKIRANNRCLARALAEEKQKLRICHDEALRLRRQLQETQEQLAEAKNNERGSAVETAMLRLVQELSEPLNTEINAAMESMLVTIDNFSKVKQLVGTLTRDVRNRSTNYSGSSSSSSSKVSLPKSSGPRDPMKSNSGQVTLSSNVSVSTSGNNWTNTRYHRVLPMVEGHTLQPAMVAIPKVDIQELWKRRQEERAQGNQVGDMGITVIEEQNSSLEISRPDSSYNQQQDEENMEETENADDSRNTSDTSDALPSSADPSTHELPFEELSPTRYQDNIFGDEFSRTYNANNFAAAKQKENAEARSKEENLSSSPEESQEDPLEGPSWRFINIEKPLSKSGRRRSSVLARKSSPGNRRRSSARISGQKASRRGRRSSVRLDLQDAVSNANDSQVSETENSLIENVSLDDGAVAVKSNSECLTHLNADDSATAANEGAGDLIQENAQDSSEGLIKDTTLNVGDASYLASPGTMLARHEDLEAKRGRKSRARSTRNSGNIPKALKHASEVGSPTVKLRRLSNEEIHSSMFMKEKGNDETLSMNESDSYGVLETDYALPLPPPLACSPNLVSLPCDYLITDQDFTCVMDDTVEMKEPVTKIIPQISQEPGSTVTTEDKTTKPAKEVTEKKFFKPRTKEVQENSRTSSKESESSVKTPFDLSMMESTMVISPYVSTKSEKENIHPSMTNILDDDLKEGRKGLKMVNVSVVLEDVMRTSNISEHEQSHIQSFSSKELPGDPVVILESPRERRKKSSSPEKTRKKSLNSSIDSVKDDLEWVPPAKKGKKNMKFKMEKANPRKLTSKSSKLCISASEEVKKRPRKAKGSANFALDTELSVSKDKVSSSLTKDGAGKEAFSPVRDAFSSPKKKYKAAAASTKNLEEKNVNTNENVTKLAKSGKPRGRPPGSMKGSKKSRSITPKTSLEATPSTKLDVTQNIILESSVQKEESSPMESKPATVKAEGTAPLKRPKVRTKPRIGVGKPRKRKTKKSKFSLTNGVDESLVEPVDLDSPEVTRNLNHIEPHNSKIVLEDALLDLNNEALDTSIDKSLDMMEDTEKDKKLSVENKNNLCQNSEPPKSTPLLDLKKEFGDDLECLLRKIKQVTGSDKDLEDGEVLPDLGAITFSEEEDKSKNSNQRKNLMTGVEAIKSLNALECVEELTDQVSKKDNREEEKSRLEIKKSIDVSDFKVEVEEEVREHRRRRTAAVTSYKEIPLNCKMRQGKENTVSISMKPHANKSKS